jgi:YD repeat-containing protein
VGTAWVNFGLEIAAAALRELQCNDFTDFRQGTLLLSSLPNRSITIFHSKWTEILVAKLEAAGFLPVWAGENSMSRAKIWLASSATTIAVLSYSALAQETTNYTYDGLGRLQGSTIAGGANSGRVTRTCFDAAGNRTRYDVATSAPTACPAPTPTPTSSP